MKTKYFYSLAAMAMLTACTSSEEFEASTPNGKQKVEFADPFVGKNLTRAESGDIKTDDLKNFSVKVWGQEVNKPSSGDLTAITGQPASSQTETPFYNGDVITWDGSAWTCTNKYYYPRDKYTFRFAAFAPVEAIQTESNTSGVKLDMKNTTTQTFTGTGDNYGITNIPLVQKIDNTSDAEKGWDLLVSNRVLSQPTYGATDRTPISFTFQHILSRLSFYVYTTNSTATVTVTDITAYLPKTTSGTACYNQNTNTANPTAETNTNTTEGTDNKYNSKNSTWSSDTHDTWKWTYNAFSDITVSTPSDFKSKISDKLSESSVTYQSYEVFKDESGQTVTYKGSFSEAISTTGENVLTNIGSEFFLAPTPAYKEGENDKVANYHFYVTVNYTVTEDSETKKYSAVLPLYESDFYRFKQGWHHKLYLNLSSKKIRFISATVSDWEGEHNEDMTVSREVDGWTAEQN